MGRRLLSLWKVNYTKMHSVSTAMMICLFLVMAVYQRKLLVVDDDPDLGYLLEKFLSSKGYSVTYSNSGRKGLLRFSESEFDAVICDYRLGDMEGLDVLKKMISIKPDVRVIVITGYSDIKTAVDVIKAGAFNYITKPLIPDEVLMVLDKAFKSTPAHHTPAAVAAGREVAIQGDDQPGILYSAIKTNKELYNQLLLVAPTNYSVIIYGESGTGKEIMARAIHQHSKRKNQPFVALDCGTVSRELAGSELFGHVKGAFTGALTDKKGLFEIADGGTVFLDEVANLPAEVQAFLLRAIQERTVKRIGGNTNIPIDIRVIVASNERLPDACRNGKFREDLYHRFNEFSMNLPPLRERKKEIPLFASFFLDQTNAELGRSIEGFDEDVIDIFLQYKWPGNLREFRNVVRRAALLTKEGSIKKEVLPWEMMQSDMQKPIVNELPALEFASGLKDSATRAEYEMIMKVLQEVNFNKTKAAAILKIDRKTLYNKMKNFEL
jgi:two-component system response regulator HydG